MTIINQPKSIIFQILGEQKLEKNKQYRPFFYIKKLYVENNLLLFNILTFEILLLNNNEIENFNANIDLSNEFFSTLAKKWFLVPVDTDDLSIVRQVENIRTAINKINAPTKFNSFTILPTTDCNARCFYCFELKNNRRTMSPETASDVAEYIIKNRLDGKIFLRWFGGEPLYNMDAIDIITTKLKAENIDFESHIITNGYLFSEDVIKKAKSLWNLKKVQITLDGTEKIYNKIKAYIYKDCDSPFKKVITNIKMLLKASVDVKIRLNLDQHNADDLFALIDYLSDIFGKYNNIKIRTNLLFEESCARIKEANSQQLKRELACTQVSLQQYAREKGMLGSSTQVASGHLGHCMADYNYSTTILPYGELGKCQSYLDDHFWGSIYSDEINYNEINWFKTVKTIAPTCDSCKFRPGCVFPQGCITIPNNCDKFDQERIDKNMDMYLNNIYNHFINKNK